MRYVLAQVWWQLRNKLFDRLSIVPAANQRPTSCPDHDQPGHPDERNIFVGAFVKNDVFRRTEAVHPTARRITSWGTLENCLESKPTPNVVPFECRFNTADIPRPLHDTEIDGNVGHRLKRCLEGARKPWRSMRCNGRFERRQVAWQLSFQFISNRQM